MKITIIPAAVTVVFTAALPFSLTPILKAQSTNFSLQVPSSWASPMWGPESNGCSAGISVTWKGDHFEVLYLVRRPANAEEFRVQRTVNEALMGPHFLLPTNGCIGPVELEGPNGRRVQPNNPALMNSNDYPTTLSWNTLVQGSLNHNIRVPGQRGSLFGAGDLKPEEEIALFDLAKYFTLDNPGDYKLTLWPKLYKKVQRDKDLFQRIDIPPVTFNFHWDGSPIIKSRSGF